MLADTSSRSISSVLRDIVQNVQDIVRSELRLAKTELGEELVKVKAAGVLLGMGAMCGFFAAFFVLLAAVFGLSNVLPSWAAALIVATAMAMMAIVMAYSGRRRLRTIHPIPEHTVETMKENIQWAKQHSK